MKKLVILMLTIIIFLPAIAQDIDRQKMDDYLELLEKHNKFMGSVCLYQDGKSIYSKAVGYRDADEGLLNETTTEFRVGSITKMFTATIIFKLIEEEKLKLKDRLYEFFPEIENARKITIQQLLNHSSGLKNITATSEYIQYMTRYHSQQAMIEKVMAFQPDFSPGEKHEYSNTNYLLLGFIIEKVTGSSYQEVLEQYITGPLQLQHTRYGGKINTAANQAFSYRYMGAWFTLPETDMSIPHGAGAIISTAGDLNIFIRALFRGEIISQASVQKMIEISDGYGHGIFEYDFKEHRGYGHGGGIDGFVSFLTYFPDIDLGIAILSNGLNYNIDVVFTSLLKIYFNENFEMPDFEIKTIELSEAEYRKFAGDFASEQLPIKLTISLSNKQLYVHPTGQSAFPLTAVSPSKFIFEMAGIEIEFAASHNEINYEEFVLKQAGNKYLFKKEINHK